MSIIKDCFDDPTVTLSVSAREVKLIMLAMNRFNDELYKGSYKMDDDTTQRWESIMDYVTDEALAQGA
jgi:hypothetical protein